MMRKSPRGFEAKLWRAPIWLYKLGLGFLLGQRFMLLTHIGRVSGLPRQAVIEVVRHDPATNNYYAASGFGKQSNWYRNICQTPQVQIQVGRHKLQANAQPLSLAEGEAELQRYAETYPRALKELSRLIGLPYDGTPESLHQLAEQVPMIAFEVQTAA